MTSYFNYLISLSHTFLRFLSYSLNLPPRDWYLFFYVYNSKAYSLLLRNYFSIVCYDLNVEFQRTSFLISLFGCEAYFVFDYFLTPGLSGSFSPCECNLVVNVLSCGYFKSSLSVFIVVS